MAKRVIQIDASTGTVVRYIATERSSARRGGEQRRCLFTGHTYLMEVILRNQSAQRIFV